MNDPTATPPAGPNPPSPALESKNQRRPRTITVASWIFIAIGGVTFIAGLIPSWNQAPANHQESFWELGMICAIRLTAVVGGVLMLYGVNWARWLMVLWVAFHLGIASLHSLFALAVHAVLFGVILYFLFRPSARAYFTSRPWN